jgi:hypothetical protein
MIYPLIRYTPILPVSQNKTHTERIKGYRKTRYIPYKGNINDFKEHLGFVGSFIGIGVLLILTLIISLGI